MTLDPTQLRELEVALADRLYLQVASWHLYLGDAGLAKELAIECSATIDRGAEVTARMALEAVKVPLAGGSMRLPLARLIPPSLIHEFEEILDPYCR